jgi:hypothetical protein
MMLWQIRVDSHLVRGAATHAVTTFPNGAFVGSCDTIQPSSNGTQIGPISGVPDPIPPRHRM